MARDFNQNRIANARLVSAGIDKFGKTFAFQSPYNADGFSSVNVTVEQAPSDIKQYLEGDNSITVYPVPSNVDKLCEYALASFPSIEDLYLFKTSAIVVLEDDLSYLLDLNKIYVPTDLLSAYQSAYPTIASKFDTIVEDYTLTIPFVGETTLTTEYVDSVIAMLSSAEKNAITKVVIPTDFSESSADAIAWGYDFSAIVNLNNNIWYGSTQYDLTTLTIKGSGTLTSAIVESSIANISSDKVSGITKIVVSTDFDIESVCVVLSDYDLSALTNLNGNIYYGSNSCKGASFANDSLETIKLSSWLDRNCPYQLGDTRNVIYNNATYTLRICDNTANRYQLTNYNNKYNKLVIEFVEIITNARMNATNTNNGGFALSEMKTTTLPNIYNNLPSDLKAVISQVSVASASDGSASGSGSLSYSDNYLFLPSGYEIYGYTGYANSLENTSLFGWYSQNTAPSSAIKQLNGTNTKWRLRSPAAGNNGAFISISAGGYSAPSSTSSNCGVAPFFCI